MKKRKTIWDTERRAPEEMSLGTVFQAAETSRIFGGLTGFKSPHLLCNLNVPVDNHCAPLENLRPRSQESWFSVVSFCATLLPQHKEHTHSVTKGWGLSEKQSGLQAVAFELFPVTGSFGYNKRSVSSLLGSLYGSVGQILLRLWWFL